MRRIVKIITIVVFCLPIQVLAAVPDSLAVVQEKLEELLGAIERCEQTVVTPDDLEFNSSTLERLRDSRNRIQASYPLSDYDELWTLLMRFDNCDKRIAERVAQWEKSNRELAIIDKMNSFCRSFDSLLSIGEGYAAHKAADSVRSIKLRADDQWSRVNALKATAEEEFEHDPLSALYGHVEGVRGKIQDLSEKEKIKPRDLLLVGAALVAALAMILTLARSIKMSKKTKESSAIEI